MKKLRKWLTNTRWLIGSTLIVWLCAFCANTLHSDELPGLSLELLTNSQVRLVVTNGVSTNNYEIYRRSVFDPFSPWTLHMIGNTGQTNFTADMGIQTVGFFQARAGSDADGDGVPNSQDAAPYNSSIGALTITIDTPVNGHTFN